MFVTACDIAFSTPRTLEDSINIRTIQCSRQTESCTETNTKHDHAYIFLNQLILCCLNSTINLRLNQSINQSINLYLLKMSRDTHKRLFNCEQDNKAETSTNSCPTNKLYDERKGKTQRVQNHLRWCAHTLYQVLYEVNNSN